VPLAAIPPTVALSLPRLLSRRDLQASSILSDNAASMIGNNSAGVIGNHAGNRRLLAFSPATNLDAEFTPYVNAVLLTNQLLGAAIKGGLQPGQSLTVPVIGGQQPKATLSLTDHGDHRVIAMAWGEADNPAQRFLAVSYTSARRGTMVFHTWEPRAQREALASSFDLDAGSVTVQILLDTMPGWVMPSIFGPEPGPFTQSIWAQWEFKQLSPATPGAPVFQMRSSGSFLNQTHPDRSKHHFMTARFLADDRAAMVIGQQALADGSPRRFLQKDLASFAPTPATFYATGDGADVAPAAADAALLGATPAGDDVLQPYPPSPAEGDPYTGSVFALPQ
jgi:hypothetical protein